MLIRAAVYGALGWIGEVIWTGLGSLLAGDPSLTSRTYLWMFPLYGLGVLLEPVHNQIREMHWFVRGLIYMFLIMAMEYSSGWLLFHIIGVCPWNYTAPLAVDGFIRLDYAPVWFTVGLIFERVHDYLSTHLAVR